MGTIAELLRPHLRELKPYSSARDEYTGTEGIFLDANENALGPVVGEGLHRYPDPYQKAVKSRLAQLKRVPANRIFLGNGSDEPIDLLFRAFCDPVLDEVLIMPPTYGMYEVSANINNIAITRVNLTKDYQIDLESVLSSIKDHTKLIFICSPNNPTGNRLKISDIESIIKAAPGLVVIDEAYIDFARDESLLHELNAYANVVILQTFSKAWGLAGLRLGMAFAHPDVVTILNKIKPPYNINQLTQEMALEALGKEEEKNQKVKEILAQRNKLTQELSELSIVEKIYPTDANFLLVKFTDAEALFDYLIEKKIITRNRSNVTLCEGSLRITVGTGAENATLLEAIESYQPTA